MPIKKVTPLKSPFSKEVYRKNAELYKVMANPKRLEILNSIVDREATVNELSKMLGTRKSNTSQHLAYLRYVGLVTTRRQGKNVFYKISDKRIVEPCKIFNELRANKAFIKASQII
jgi:DNA-binding transcriptional ArsR family regulator